MQMGLRDPRMRHQHLETDICVRVRVHVHVHACAQERVHHLKAKANQSLLGDI